jgi:hypothetical protein
LLWYFLARLLLKAFVNADVKPGVSGIPQFQSWKVKAGGKESRIMKGISTNASSIAGSSV